MSNPGIQEANRKDPYIGLHACISAGQRYAQHIDPRRPDISPIYGTFEGLGPIILFVGTHDIMHPDCEKLRMFLQTAGVEYQHVVYDDMVHDWMFLKLPESKECRKQIAAIIMGQRSNR